MKIAADALTTPWLRRRLASGLIYHYNQEGPYLGYSFQSEVAECGMKVANEPQEQLLG